MVTFDPLFYFISYLKYALPTSLYLGEEVSPLRGYSRAVSPSRLSRSKPSQANLPTYHPLLHPESVQDPKRTSHNST
jgi:hypothetical protein